MEDQRLIELQRERIAGKVGVGDICVGRVRRFAPNLNAAFVDIGAGRDAFLHYSDLGVQYGIIKKLLKLHQREKSTKEEVVARLISSAEQLPKEGALSDVISTDQLIPFQITKEPISAKGCRIVCGFSLAGRNVVLVPFSNKVSISQKIRDTKERERLRQLVSVVKPKNFGLIVRTLSEGKKVAELAEEINRLEERWNKAWKKIASAKEPDIVSREAGRTEALVRDMLGADFQGIYINDRRGYNDLKSYVEQVAPDNANLLKFYDKQQPIMEHFGVAKQIKSSFGKKVYFGKEGYLVIEHTEAFHVIDINSGVSRKDGESGDNAFNTNMEAINEIIRQIRLRDMGGIIVIDFIDMYEAAQKKEVHRAMVEAMSGDRARNKVLPLSKFCLMQLTRQRVRPVTTIDTTEVCPVCEGKGRIAPAIQLLDKIEQALFHLSQNKKSEKMVIKTHPFVHSHITRGLFSSQVKRWKKSLGLRLSVVADDSYSMLEFRIFNTDDKELHNFKDS